MPLNSGAGRLREAHGLEAYPGGDHPAWGTGNAIVPLGDEYIEILGNVIARSRSRPRSGSGCWAYRCW